MRWVVKQGMDQVCDDIGADGPIIKFFVWFVAAGLAAQVALLFVAIAAALTDDWGFGLWLLAGTTAVLLPFTFRKGIL